ncbi:hypothetical protein WSM22_35060 [Cytophagales bacterium WSM2-2]|nr:hypothetical protein WSM22_35060 [Cytophagales bacterium WSM2-2]
MKKIALIFWVTASLFSCNSSKNKDESTSDTVQTADQESSLYAEIDSTFTIDGQKFKVNVKQFDLTEQATAKGDTLSRPTYKCIVTIADSNKKMLLSDSVTRDSWGYPGKIVAIDAYQVTMPLLSASGSEIIFKFKVFELKDDDAIDGFISFDTKKLAPKYYWKESTDGD